MSCTSGGKADEVSVGELVVLEGGVLNVMADPVTEARAFLQILENRMDYYKLKYL